MTVPVTFSLSKRSGVAVVLVVLVVLAACGTDPQPTREPLVVLAASSLTESFAKIETAFEEEHADVDVQLSFAASSALVQQLAAGAPADVLATADEATMNRAVDAADVQTPQKFARNRLALIVEAGNPLGIASLADLANPGTLVALCAPEVPCGRLAAAALTKAGVTIRSATLEESVKAVASKVTLGEADAGIVYATDIKSKDTAAVAIDVASDPDLEAHYFVAVAAEATNAEAAADFVAYLRGAKGQSVLESLGFLAA